MLWCELNYNQRNPMLHRLSKSLIIQVLTAPRRAPSHRVPKRVAAHHGDETQSAAPTTIENHRLTYSAHHLKIHHCSEAQHTCLYSCRMGPPQFHVQRIHQSGTPIDFCTYRDNTHSYCYKLNNESQ